MHQFHSLRSSLLAVTLVGLSLIGLAPVTAAPASSPASVPSLHDGDGGPRQPDDATGTYPAGVLLGQRASVARPAAARPLSHTSAFAQAPRPHPCFVTTSDTAHPAEIVLGQHAELNLFVGYRCLADDAHMHLVIVIDNSESMSGDPLDRARERAVQLVRNLDLEHQIGIKVGIVAGSEPIRTMSELSNDSERAIGAIEGITIDEDATTSLAAGIAEALAVLTRGRADPGGGASPDVLETMLLLSDGSDVGGCDPVMTAAARAKAEGVLVISVCPSRTCDDYCLWRTATAYQDFYRLDGSHDVNQVLRSLGSLVPGFELTSLVVTDTLPSTVRYVPDTAAPPAQLSGGATAIEWRLDFVPGEGVTLSVDVEPLEIGHQPTSLGAKGTYTDRAGRSGVFAFEAPFPAVRVIGPGTPTSTPLVPSPTAVVSPTATVDVPTPTAVVTPTATDSHAVPGHWLYLPSAVKPPV